MCCLFILFPLHAKIFKFHAVPSIFTFVACAFSVISKKSLPNSMSWSFYIWYARYNILGWLGLFSFSFFLLAFWIYHPIPFWFARFPLRNSIIILQEILLFFHCFLKFSLAVIFDSLSIFLSVGLFGFILMGVSWSFWICMSISFLKFGSLGLLFLQIGFQTIYFSPLSETPVMCNWPIKWHPTSPLGSLYSPCLSFCSSDSVISNDLSSSSQILFSVWFSLQLISYSQCLI